MGPANALRLCIVDTNSPFLPNKDIALVANEINSCPNRVAFLIWGDGTIGKRVRLAAVVGCSTQLYALQEHSNQETLESGNSLHLQRLSCDSAVVQ